MSNAEQLAKLLKLSQQDRLAYAKLDPRQRKKIAARELRSIGVLTRTGKLTAGLA